MDQAGLNPVFDLPIVTRNQGKLREISEILKLFRIRAFSAYHLTNFDEVNENGDTYAENALLKARQGYVHTGGLCAGEDSGLEVDELDGAPGLFSARFGEKFAFVGDNNTLLLSLLEGVPPERRSARFRAAVALAWEGGEKLFEGVCEGWIRETPRGEGGFGYDPVFIFPLFEKTFAELDVSVKNTYSHRAVAFRSAGEFILKNLLKGSVRP
ncbi:MAG TPA: RdgB/HAM1 family non-canonical purine NTP pyrophosphatase [Atribacteraceae bacterium]|nr:RdgB/HAM1 family non-canonical purine NTP pyrophosphatase [Atribacteraceae bacterium]